MLHDSNTFRKLSVISCRIWYNCKKARKWVKDHESTICQLKYNIFQFHVSCYGSLIIQGYIYILLGYKRPGSCLHFNGKM